MVTLFNYDGVVNLFKCISSWDISVIKKKKRVTGISEQILTKMLYFKVSMCFMVVIIVCYYLLNITYLMYTRKSNCSNCKMK